MRVGRPRLVPAPPRAKLLAMRHGWTWTLAKGLEALGMIVVLVGLVISIRLGLDEDGLGSMRYEGMALLIGGGLFLVGWMLERAVGGR